MTNNLDLYRFQKSLSRAGEALREAKATMESLRDAATKNVETQKILNTHLAKQNEQWRSLGKTPTAPKPLLTLVK